MTFEEEQHRLYLDGDPLAVHNVAIYCLWNGRVIPDWARAEIERMIRQDMEERPSRGKGVVAPAAAAIRRERDEGWFNAVEMLRGMPAQFVGRAGGRPVTLREAVAEVARLASRTGRITTDAMVSRGYEREKRRRGIPKVAG